MTTRTWDLKREMRRRIEGGVESYFSCDVGEWDSADLCESGIRRFFDIPRGIDALRLHVSDRKPRGSESALPLRILVDGDGCSDRIRTHETPQRTFRMAMSTTSVWIFEFCDGDTFGPSSRRSSFDPPHWPTLWLWFTYEEASK